MKELERCNLCGNSIDIFIKPHDDRWFCGCQKCARSGKQFAVAKSRTEAIQQFVDMNFKVREAGS